MGFTVDKKEFVKALATIMPAVPTRSTLPILSGVKLTAADTRFAMEATDLELIGQLLIPRLSTWRTRWPLATILRAEGTRLTKRTDTADRQVLASFDERLGSPTATRAGTALG